MGSAQEATPAAKDTGKEPAKGKVKKPVKSTAGTTTAVAARPPSSSSAKRSCTSSAERERDNMSHIKWDSDADGVQGTYTGYSQEHTCKMVEGTEKRPRRQGPVPRVPLQETGPHGRRGRAEHAEPVEVFEVQEIFHFLKGKWDY